MAIFWLVFSAKNPVKSDKLALIEGKILNLLFLDINIPVAPIEIWGAYHLTENFGNSGWKVNGKVTFRNFQPKIEEYVLR